MHPYFKTISFCPKKCKKYSKYNIITFLTIKKAMIFNIENNETEQIYIRDVWSDIVTIITV